LFEALSSTASPSSSPSIEIKGEKPIHLIDLKTSMKGNDRPRSALVKASLLTLKSGFSIQNSRFHLKGAISDGTDEVDIEFSHPVCFFFLFSL